MKCCVESIYTELWLLKDALVGEKGMGVESSTWEGVCRGESGEVKRRPCESSML